MSYFFMIFYNFYVHMKNLSIWKYINFRNYYPFRNEYLLVLKIVMLSKSIKSVGLIKILEADY